MIMQHINLCIYYYISHMKIYKCSYTENYSFDKKLCTYFRVLRGV